MCPTVMCYIRCSTSVWKSVIVFEISDKERLGAIALSGPFNSILIEACCSVHHYEQTFFHTVF